MSDSVRPHRRQPTGFCHPWGSPGKKNGVGCHFLLQCMEVKSEREVSQSCTTLHDPVDCSPPGSSVHGIYQARILKWVAIAFSDMKYRTIFFFLMIETLHIWFSCSCCQKEFILVHTITPQIYVSIHSICKKCVLHAKAKSVMVPTLIELRF